MLSIHLCDTTLDEEFESISQMNHQATSFGFHVAYAFNCDCDYYDYKPMEIIDSIEVISLLNFSTEILAGDNINNYLVAKKEEYRHGNLYVSLCELIESINSPNVIDNARTVFSLVFTKAPIYNTAQFEINIHLSNGITLTGNTPTISLTDTTDE